MKQIFSNQAQSAEKAQAENGIESILATRRWPPSSRKHYNKARGFAVHDRFGYKAGTIILAGPMYNKTRPAIVVAQLPESFVVVPLLTHNGDGLRHYHKKREYMSICDQREGGWFKVQNDMPVLLTEDGTGMTGSLILPESTVHFTDPFDVNYSRKTLILGRLCQHSVPVLLEHYQKFSIKEPQLVRGPMPAPKARTSGRQRSRR